jgi:DNA-binding NtrC family response regulator
MTVLVHTGDAALDAALVERVRRIGHGCETVKGALLAKRIALGDARALILDLSAPDAEAALAARNAASAPVGLVALLADATPASLVAAERRGATRILRKPFDTPQLERAITLAARFSLGGEPLVGLAPASRALAQELRALAPTDLSVALHGESGTGKTRLARWLHANGARHAGRFEEADCAELGREAMKSGSPHEVLATVLGAARGGTLVLDEPGQLERLLQGPLLAWLEAQGRELRVVTTSRRRLAEAVASGRLMAELADRLAVLELEVPPLRARRADLPELAEELGRLAAARTGDEPPRLDEAARIALLRSELPGNVRQLESLMQRAALLFPGHAIAPGFFERPHGEALGLLPFEPRNLSLRELERAAIARALEVARGNRTRAARALGISVRTLRNRLKRG